MRCIKRYTVFRNTVNNECIIYITELNKELDTPNYCTQLCESFVGNFDKQILNSIKRKYHRIIAV